MRYVILDLNKSKSQIALDRIVSRKYIPVKQATAISYLGAPDWEIWIKIEIRISDFAIKRKTINEFQCQNIPPKGGFQLRNPFLRIS